MKRRKVDIVRSSFRLHHSIYECAPGRADSLQNCRTGFESLRSCSIADVAEQLGAGFVNRLMLVRIQSSALFTNALRV